MAQRVNVILVDDLDGSDASETIGFSVDGVDYEIDLNDEHATELREAFALYVGHARRTGGRRRGQQARSTGRQSGRAKASDSAASAAEIREWARDNGWEVSERGRVSAEIRDAYEAAH